MQTLGLLAALILALSITPAHAATPPKPPAKASPLPRTPDGHPDFQGVVWAIPYMGTLQIFPTAPAELVLPEDKAKVAYERLARLVTSTPQVAIDAESVAVFLEAKGFPLVRGERRTRLLVTPANGRLPFTAAVAREAAGLMSLPNKADNPEDRLIGERCLTQGAVPPMAFTSPLHPRQFVQTPQFVALQSEYGDEVRVIPFTDRHGPAGIEQPMGDSIARWEGETLVIETTNNPGWARLRPFPVTLIVGRDSKVIERFTRVSADELNYQFTVEDPAIYSAPWLAEYSLYRADYIMRPSECHEGNYGLPNILSGAREEEKAAAAKAAAAR